MAKKVEEKRRLTLYERSQQRSKDLSSVLSDFIDNEEVIDEQGNISTKKRVFEQLETVDDFKIEVLRETNPAALDPSNYCMMSAGTPIERASRIDGYMDNVGYEYDSIDAENKIKAMEQSLQSQSDNNDNKEEE